MSLRFTTTRLCSLASFVRLYSEKEPPSLAEKARVNSEFTTVYLKGGIIFTPCLENEEITSGVESAKIGKVKRKSDIYHAPV